LAIPGVIKRADHLTGPTIRFLAVVVTVTIAILSMLPATVRAADNTDTLVKQATPAGSRLLTDRTEQVSSYRLALSGLKRQAATTFAEQEVRVSGQLRRLAWESSEKLDLDAAINPLLLALKSNLDNSILYQCSDLDCGSSHFWANEIFGNGRLVGRDNQQRLLVAYLPQADTNGSDSEQTVVMFYVTNRGPRQTVAGMNILRTSDRVLPEVISRADIEGRLSASSGWLPGMVTAAGQLDLQQSSELIAVLKGLSDGVKQRLHLVVHCYESGDMAENQSCSDRIAQQLRVATFDGHRELNVSGGAALALAPQNNNQPALRFVFWPRR